MDRADLLWRAGAAREQLEKELNASVRVTIERSIWDGGLVDHRKNKSSSFLCLRNFLPSPCPRGEGGQKDIRVSHHGFKIDFLAKLNHLNIKSVFTLKSGVHPSTRQPLA